MNPSNPDDNGTTISDSGTPKEADERQLGPEHIDYLHARAVPVELAIQAGLRSVSAEEAGKLLGRAGPTASPGLAIPYSDLSPRQWRIRLDTPTGGAPYLCEANREVPVYVPPAMPGDDQPTIVVESPVKALALAAAGFRAVGLGGTSTTLTKDEEPRRLNASWKRVAVRNKPVVILFDANRTTNASVARDEAALAIALETDGAKVRIAALPPSPDGASWGPDDFLAQRSAETLRAVIGSAHPADPIARAQSTVPATVAALLDDLPFLLAVTKRGPGCRSQVRQAMKSIGKISVKDFDEALAQARTKLRKAEEGSGTQSGLGGQYFAQQGAICTMELGEVIQLCNFTAEIERETLSDDGVTETRSFEMTGRTQNGKTLPRIVVTPAELRTEGWALEHWGSCAVVGPIPGTASHLRVAIQTRSAPEHVREYAHTGWRDLGGRSVFLHAGGALGAPGIQTRLSGRLGQYILPENPIDVAGAVRQSLRFLDIAPRKITLPIFAAVYRAPTQSLLPCDSTIWACGHTGTLKTTAASLAAAHFGRFDRNSLPAGWHDTAAHIEYTMFLAKDVLLVIDDFAPRGAENWDELHRKAEYVLRSIGNQTSRGRMRSDLSERPERPPRALVMVTGEDLPNGQSILARILPVHFEPGLVNKTILSDLQAQQKRLPHAMAGYILWLQPRLEELGDQLHERFVARRAEFHGGQTHLRTPETLAHLVLGFELFGEFAVEVGVIGKRDAGHMLEEAVAVFRQLGDVQGNVVGDEDPAEKFMATLRTLIAQGKVEIVANLNDVLLPVGGVQQIGWRDEEAAYLLPEATYTTVVGAMRAAGGSFPLKESTLWARLRASGVLKPGDEGHATSKKVCGRRRARVIVMSLQALELGGPDDEPNHGAPVPPVSDAGEKMAEKPGQGGEKSGRGTAESGRGGGCTAGGGKEDQLLTSSPSPPRPAAPTEEEGSHIAVSPVATAEQQIACNGSSLEGPHAVDNRGVGALSSKCGDSQENLRPGGEPTPQIVSGAQLLVTDYKLIRDPADLASVACAVEAADEVAVDFETTGLDPLIDRPRLLQIGLQSGQVFILDLFALGKLGPVGDVIKAKQILAHNLRFELKFLKHHFGIEPASGWDTMTAAKLLDKGQRREDGYFALDAVCKRELGVKLDKSSQTSDWSAELTEAQLAYAATDVVVLGPLRKKLALALTAADLDRVANLEFEVLAPVVAMELFGVRIDRDAWTSLFNDRQAEAERLRRLATEALGVENINSTPQVLKALNRLGITATHTSAEALAPFIDHPVVVTYVRYKAAATFPRTIGKHIMDALTNALKLDSHHDGRIHPSLNPLAAPTGRFGCKKPNLLAMPKDPAVRGAVVPSPHFEFVRADYGAIELRVLAQIANDSALISLFKANGDPHKRTAAAVLGIDESQVSDTDRGKGKWVNFGFDFGAGAKRFVISALAEYNTVFSLAEAMRFREIYLRTYRGVARWQAETRARMPLEVRTASGRIRRFDDRKKGYCERLNTPVQGTAADGMKAALILLHRRLPPLGARLVLCVHDEVLVEAPEGRTEEVKAVVESSMIEGMRRFVTAVPIVVETSIRPTWAKPKKRE